MSVAVTVSAMPAEVSAFVGRRRELTEVKRVLGASRMVTLAGMGGVGKTRLALQVARRTGRAFPDGVAFVELAGLTEETLLVPTVGQAVGWADQREGLSAQALARFLSDRELLLVLDNCEHLVDACTDLCAVLLRAAPGVRILATSRRPLRIDGEQVISVMPLGVPRESVSASEAATRWDAVALFDDRARAQTPSFVLTDDNVGQVVELCHRLEGLPLALELAASRLRTQSVERILQALEQRGTFLSGTAGRRPARQRSLENVIDWSYGLLTPRDRLLFTRLCVFPADGFDLTAAEHVCTDQDLPADDVLPALLNLIDQSLVAYDPNTGSGRYHILEMVRRFGLDRLTEAGQLDLLHQRHRAHYQRLALQAHEHWFGPDQLTWTNRFRTELANWRAALTHALGHPGESDDALRIAAALAYYWRMTGMVSEGRQWLEKALTAHPRPSAWRAHALWRCAWFTMLQGDYAIAAHLVDEAKALAERVQDRSSLAGAFFIAGWLEGLRGDPNRGIEVLRQAEKVAQETGDADTLARALSERASLEPGGNRAGLEEALHLCEEHGERWWRGVVLRDLALQEWRAGDPQSAIRMIGEALRIHRPYGDTHNIGKDLLSLSVIATAAGRHREAARLLGAGRSAMRAAGSEATILDDSFYGPPVHDAAQELSRALGEDFSHLVEAGGTMPLTQAIDEALGAPAGNPTGAPGRTRRANGEQRAVLTPREREVAALVARGLTNRQIAAHLVISTRTAEGTVSRILTKLGLTTRTQIARWAADAVIAAKDHQ